MWGVFLCEMIHICYFKEQLLGKSPYGENPSKTKTWTFELLANNHFFWKWGSFVLDWKKNHNEIQIPLTENQSHVRKETESLTVYI